MDDYTGGCRCKVTSHKCFLRDIYNKCEIIKVKKFSKAGIYESSLLNQNGWTQSASQHLSPIIGTDIIRTDSRFLEVRG